MTSEVDIVIWLQCVDKTCRVYLNLIEKSKSIAKIIGFFTLEDGIDRLSRNAGK